MRYPNTRKLLDRIALHIPVFRILLIDSSINRFLNIRDSLFKDMQAIIEGKLLHESLKNNKYVSDITKTLIETGENSAKIESTIEKAIYYYNRNIEKRIDIINRLMEPAIIIIIALIVVVVVVALAIPIFKISSGGLSHKG